jgi:DNA-binding beta-propeller fold protein YncE
MTTGRLHALLPALAVALALAAPGTAQARDRFYYMGYGVIQVIDGDTDAIVADIPIKGATREASLGADRKFLWVSTNRHLVHKVDLAENRVVATVDVSNAGWDRVMFGFVVNADGRTGYGGFMSRRTDKGDVVIGKPVVAQVDLGTGELLRSVEVPWGVAHLVSVQGGRTIYAFGQDLYKIDTTGAELRVSETVPMFDKGMNILPFWDYAFDNGGVASMNYYTEKHMGLLLVDQQSGAVNDVVLKGEPALAYSVVLAPDRKKAYAVMDDLTVIDLVKKTYAASVPVNEGTSYGVNVSSDGKKVYVAGGGSTLTVYDAATLRPLKVLQMASDGMDLRRVSF